MIQFKQISGVFVMGIISLLFGCKEVELIQPDFTNSMNKVIHLNNGATLSYEMPGNMSNNFNFSERYKVESPKTYRIDISDTSEYKPDTWKLAKKIDGGMWDYFGDKKKGLNGELGSLNVALFISEYSDGNIERYVLNAYENFLNGPDGLNTKMRSSEMGQSYTDIELGDWIVNAPPQLNRITFGGKEYFHWQVKNENRGREFVYYIFPLDDKHFISFMFHYTVKVKDEQGLAAQTGFVLADIARFMKHVEFHEKQE